mmetsp:Transcript_18504/g.26134  ORF Transcript_18504/g.26134 Transcript_18504/m.26134 type:complete len:336 (+) Transcript_18504:193-1200(+)
MAESSFRISKILLFLQVSISTFFLLGDVKLIGCFAFQPVSPPLKYHVVTSRSMLSPYPSKETTKPTTTMLKMSALPPPPLTVWEGAMSIVKNFSKSALTGSSATAVLQTITAKALATPPLAYFVALLSAGVGVPVSEDALCIFAGAVWPTMAKVQQQKLFLALYMGIVLSDVVTFWIGRALRLGVFQPLQEKLLGQNADDDLDDDDDVSALPVVAIGEPIKTRKRDRIRKLASNAGEYVGFVMRFSVGTRGPLMLLTGFWRKVVFWKFLVGTSLGAAITLPLQLWLGYTLGRKNPAAIIGIVAGISTFVIGAAISVGVASWGTLLWSRLRREKSE